VLYPRWKRAKSKGQSALLFALCPLPFALFRRQDPATFWAIKKGECCHLNRHTSTLLPYRNEIIIQSLKISDEFADAPNPTRQIVSNSGEVTGGPSSIHTAVFFDKTG